MLMGTTDDRHRPGLDPELRPQDSMIEKPPKPAKRKLTKCQDEAELIVERPELLGDESKIRRTSFETSSADQEKTD